ncbi:MAG TPA: hypothetical protein VL400_22555, partial [Polyangiaceae bacterium]|nr:hypothetical protein [Polyangiaceae bacterium]
MTRRAREAPACAVWGLAAALAAAALAPLGCDSRGGEAPSASASVAPPDPETLGEEALRIEERALLATTDFRRGPGVDLGADPARILAVPSGFVVLERGRA